MADLSHVLGQASTKTVEETVHSQEWQPIINKVNLPDPPDFPIEALPSVLADLTMEVSNSIKVPPALVAAASLAYTGLAIGRNIYYFLKEGVDGRANLYMLIFAARGERKSSVESLLKKPFDKWLIEQSKEYNQVLNDNEIATKRKNVLMNKLSKEDDFNSKESADMRDKIQDICLNMDDDPPNPNIFSNNITQEALLQKLSVCGGTVAIFSDDGRASLKMIMGTRYSKDGDAQDEVFLDGYDGSKTLSYERSGRSIAPIERPCIGLMLMCQPDMLQFLGNKKEVFDSGFASRCLFCFPESWVGKRNADGSLKRDIDDVELSKETMKRYSDMICKFMNRAYQNYNKEPEYIGLSTEAKDFWKEHYREIEGESCEGGKHYATLAVAIRYPNQTLRLALLMSQVEEHSQITLMDIKNAKNLIDYFIINAQRCYSYMNEMAMPDDAWKIINYWLKTKKYSCSLRDMYRPCGITSERANEVIALLEKRNFCRRATPKEKVGAGRTPSDLYEINPELFQTHEFFS